MSEIDAGVTLADRFRDHAALCSSPLYAELMRGMAEDWEAAGPVREVCRGWEDAPRGTVLQLRLLGGLHRIVLSGRAPDLAAYYRNLGGEADPATAWPVARGVIADHVQELRVALDVAPQTNEPGRSAALLVGLLDAVSRSGLRRVRLLEVGASGGLNLLVDRFRIGGERWCTGPADSPLELPGAVAGDVHPDEAAYEIVERRGCDLSPVDAATEDGRRMLTSFVWPDHLHRHQRLAAALEVATEHPVHVEAAPAGDWLEQVLAEPVADDVLTVVWQSITRLYWPADEVGRVERAVEDAGRRLPLAHVAMEYPAAGEPTVELTVDVWRDGHPDGLRRHLADVADHGVPVTLHDGVRVPPPARV